MKKGKRLLALVIAVSLVAGLAPMSSTSYAEETTPTESGYTFTVNGPVVVEQETGKGVADITVYSNGEKTREVDDAPVEIAALKGKGCSLYQGDYSVTTSLTEGEITKVAEGVRVFVVSDIDETVTKMSDERWTGNTTTAKPRFTVDEDGKATLTASGSTKAGLSVLNMNNDASYTNFYVEYTLTVSGLEAAKDANDKDINHRSDIYNVFDISSYGTATAKSSWLEMMVFDDRDSQKNAGKEFWARLTDLNNSNTSYSDTKTATDGIVIGTPVKVGMLVYGNKIELFFNGESAIVYTDETSSYTGWFGISHGNVYGTAVVENFVYIPLAAKTVVDLDVAEIEDVQRYGEIVTPAVSPVYNWPNVEQVDATPDGVSVTGFNNTIVGQQTVTVSKDGFSKKVTVNVVDNSTEIIASEKFDSNPFEDTTKWTTSNNVVVENGAVSLPNNANATAYTTEYFMDGYVEADITLSDNITAGKTIYAPTLICRQASRGGGEIRARFVIKNANGSYTAQLQTLVVNNQHYPTDRAQTTTMYYGTNVNIEEFKFNQAYTVRLTCIGNYVETRLDGKVVAQYIIPDGIGVNEIEGNFGFQNDYSSTNGGVGVSLDNLAIVKYTTYGINHENTNIILPTYNKVKVTGDSYVSATRNAFHSDETVVLTVPEDQQLAVGGLTYTLDGVTDSATYSVFERLYDKKEKPEVCNQFKFEMPSSDITLSAQYYDASSGEANIGARDAGIRENNGEVKRGLRFSSRAYTTYTSGETTYTLKEVGTLLFNGDVTITEEILKSCHATKDNDKKLYDNDVLIGKCIPATKAQNICNDFWDWGVILTYADSYEDTNNLYEKSYIAYAYAVYVDSEGKEVVQYASDEKSATQSYNAVAEAIGWSVH